MTTRWQDLTSEQRDAFTQVFDAHLLYGELTAETPPLAEPGIGFADLYAAATDPAAAIDDRLRRALAAAPRLRQDFARIVQRTARWHGPRLAAASTGATDVRHGEGFVVRLKPSSSTPGEVYVLIDLIDRTAEPPAVMLVRDAAGDLVKQPLPAARQGRIQVLAAADSDLVRGLRAAGSEVFLR